MYEGLWSPMIPLSCLHGTIDSERSRRQVVKRHEPVLRKRDDHRTLADNMVSTGGLQDSPSILADARSKTWPLTQWMVRDKGCISLR